ncbi:MAG: alpha-L-arabinofuranosidase, partial [Acidobacteriota bacterium]
TRSPWMIIGDHAAVTMEGADSYVGEQTPRITLHQEEGPAGILQERLGLVDGREYSGRIVLSGDASAAPITVSLVWGGGAGDRDTVTIDSLPQDYEKFPLEFRSGRSTDNGRLEITGHGTGSFKIGTVSLMPSDNILGWRKDTVALLKELDSPVYRWPGGNFVSGYDWKDGIGDRDQRPPRKNPAWKGIEHNDVGIHEFMDLCREIGTEAYIAVNTGLGGIEAAAEEVEYLNGTVETPMGKLRAENGHPKPFGVKWWAVGNEMYGDWQLGHMPLEEYTKKHNLVVEAMRRVDPSIYPVAVGSMGEWSSRMLSDCSEHMDLISEHLYWQDRDSVVEHVAQAVSSIRQVADAHRQYRKELDVLKGKDIRIALDEWNYWYGPNEYGELGVRYFLQDALGIAAGLHEMFRNSDMFFMANYAQTVNVIGAIKTTPTEAEFAATGLVLKLYRQHYGAIPVTVEGDFGDLDITAALTEDQTGLTVAVVNPTEDQAAVPVSLTGNELSGTARAWTLTGKDRWAYNAPGKAPMIQIDERSFDGPLEKLEVPPLSVTLYWLPIK